MPSARRKQVKELTHPWVTKVRRLGGKALSMGSVSLEAACPLPSYDFSKMTTYLKHCEIGVRLPLCWLCKHKQFFSVNYIGDGVYFRVERLAQCATSRHVLPRMRKEGEKKKGSG